MTELYGPAVVAFAENEAELARLISGKVVDRALRRIYAADFDPDNEIETNLFNHTLAALNEAAEKGFGKISYKHPDYEFLQEVKYNNAVFAAFKTHRQQNDLFAQLCGSDGTPKPFAEFKKDTETIIGNYNINWLQTEHTTAIKRARIAVQSKQFEREKHIYPNLKWLPSMAAVPRESHKPFYNRVWVQGDVFWKSHRPGDEWGCLCGLTSTDEPVTGGKISTKDMPAASPGLDNNPVDDGCLFSETHPYIKNGYGPLKARRELAEQAADVATLKDWAEDVSGAGQVRGRTMDVFSLDKKVRAFLKKQGVETSSDRVVLSDGAIRHMTRAAKVARPTVGEVANIAGCLEDAVCYFDSVKNNLVFFRERPEGDLLKFVVQPEYTCKVAGKKMKCNYVVTGGHVDKAVLNQQQYIKIRKT